MQSEEDPVNIAFTDMELDFHMDLVYYESPPGLQMLHCVRLAIFCVTVTAEVDTIVTAEVKSYSHKIYCRID